MGGRPRACALPDGDVRRDGRGELDWGLVAGRIGTSEALLITSGVLLAGAALGFIMRLPEAPSANLDPLSRWIEPDVALDIRPRSGPIVITIEYIIREEDELAFLRAMADRRRVRRRDGARHWTLLRDLADPRIWVERYHNPTWLEYVRHNQRMTKADAVIGGEPARASPGAGAAPGSPDDRAPDRVGELGPRAGPQHRAPAHRSRRLALNRAAARLGCRAAMTFYP